MRGQLLYDISSSHTKLNFTRSVATENKLLEDYVSLEKTFNKLRMRKW